MMRRVETSFYQEISGSGPVPAFVCGWAHVQLLPAAPYSVRGRRSSHTFGLAFERQRGVHALARDKRCDFDAWPGEFSYLAPGADIFSESCRGGEYLTLQVAPTETDLPAAMGNASPRAAFGGDRRALHLGWQLRRLLLAPQRDPAAIEECTALLLQHGTSLLAVRRNPGSRASIDRAAYADVLEHIETHLDGPLPLADLAHVLDLPLLRFLRGFTAVFGITPHAYITERRLQRARTRLRRDAESIAAIATDCGFSHQSHLGAAFRKQLGMSPLQYRQLSLGDEAFER